MTARDFIERYKGEIAHIKLSKEQLAKLLIGQELKGFRTVISLQESE